MPFLHKKEKILKVKTSKRKDQTNTTQISKVCVKGTQIRLGFFGLTVTGAKRIPGLERLKGMAKPGLQFSILPLFPTYRTVPSFRLGKQQQALK